MFRKFLATFFLSVFVLAFVPSVFLWGSAKTVSGSDFFSQEFYQFVREWSILEGAEYLEENLDFGVDSGDFYQVLDSTVEVSDVEFMVSDLKKQIFETRLDHSDRLQLKLPLMELLSRNEDFYLGLSDLLYADLDICLEDQSFIGQNGELICMPENFSDLDLAANVRSIIDREIFLDVPDEISLNLPVKINGTFAEFLSGTLAAILFFSALFLLLLLIVIALIIFRPMTMVFSWLARTFFFASLVLMIFLGLILFLPGLIFANDQLLVGFFALTFGVVAKNLLYYAASIFILSLVLWFIMNRYNQD